MIVLAYLDHEQLLATDTLRPEDRDLLRAIYADAIARRQTKTIKRIREYYRDGDRSDRTPRSLVYLHLGFAIGFAMGDA